jgi:UDP-glucose 4-epimerase
VSLSLKTSKVLVTGASGFLGSSVCGRLLEVAAEVQGVSRSIPVSPDSDIRWFQGDLRQPETARALLRTYRPDVVFHLAGATNASASFDMVLPTLHDNLVATVNLLHAVESVGTCRRIILTASLEEPTDKTVTAVAMSPYAASKWAGSIYARMFHQCYGTPLVMVRPYMTYGPRQKKEKVIPHTILSLLKNETAHIASGHRLVDWVYIEDVVAGVLMAAEKEKIEGRTIDLGSGTGVSIREVVETLDKIIASPAKPVFADTPQNAVQDAKIADMVGAYETLGWKPSTPLVKGLEQTVNWYKAHSPALIGTGRSL